MKPPLSIIEFLEFFGLSGKEQGIYLAALELGESLQAPLAEQAGVKRTTLRELLPDMIARGVLEQVVKGKRKLIVAKDPRLLIDGLQSKLQQAQSVLPELLALQNTLPNKPQVRFYEGVAGVKQVYEQTLKLGQTIYSFVEIEAIHPEIQKWLSGDYSRERKSRKIRALNIVNTSDKVSTIMPADEWRENKFVNSKIFPFRMEVLVFGDYVGFIHFRQTDIPTAILIQSQAAAVTIRSIHQLFWER